MVARGGAALVSGDDEGLNRQANPPMRATARREARAQIHHLLVVGSATGAMTRALEPEPVSRRARDRSARISEACWYRTSRSFSSAFWMMRSRSAGTCGFR